MGRDSRVRQGAERAGMLIRGRTVQVKVCQRDEAGHKHQNHAEYRTDTTNPRRMGRLRTLVLGSRSELAEARPHDGFK